MAAVFARRAMATFPLARRSAMMPEPTTVAVRAAVPANSASARWGPLCMVGLLTAPGQGGKGVF